MYKINTTYACAPTQSHHTEGESRLTILKPTILVKKIATFTQYIQCGSQSETTHRTVVYKFHIRYMQTKSQHDNCLIQQELQFTRKFIR